MDTHATAPNRYLEANSIRYAYRRFGSDKGVPLLFLQHFRGGMDHWDPLVTDGLAGRRSVILVDGAGVGGSSGATPDTIEAMAEDLRHFLTALDVKSLDVLGFSIGGTIAQSLVLQYPELVRRLVLVGTRPKGGESSGGRGRDPEVARVAGNPTPTLEDFLGPPLRMRALPYRWISRCGLTTRPPRAHDRRVSPDAWHRPDVLTTAQISEPGHYVT